MDTPYYFYKHNNKLFLEIYVQPKASKNKIIGKHGDKLKIAIKAPPVDNQANQELIDFIAKTLAISKQQVNVVKGLTSRNKLVAIIAPPKNALTLLAF